MSTSNIISDNIAIINIINEFSTTDLNKPYQKTYKSLEKLLEKFKAQEDNLNKKFVEKHILTPESIVKTFVFNSELELKKLINDYRSILFELIHKIQKLKSDGVFTKVYENINKLINIYQNIKNSLDSENENTFLEYYRDINYAEIQTEHNKNIEKLRSLEQQIKNIDESGNLVESVILEIDLKKKIENIFDALTPESKKVDRIIKALTAEWEEADRLKKEEEKKIKKLQRLKRFRKRADAGKPTDFRSLKVYKERAKKYLLYIYLIQLKVIEDTRYELDNMNLEWKSLNGKFKRFENILSKDDYYFFKERIENDLKSSLGNLFKKIKFDGIFGGRNIYSYDIWSKDLYQSIIQYKERFKSLSKMIQDDLDNNYLGKQINIDLVKGFKKKYYDLLNKLIARFTEIKNLIEYNEQNFNRQNQKHKIKHALTSPEDLAKYYLAADNKLMIHDKLLEIVNSSKLFVLKIFSLIDSTILKLIKDIDIFKFGIQDLEALVAENKERENIIKQIQSDLSSDTDSVFKSLLERIDDMIKHPLKPDEEFINVAIEILEKELPRDDQEYGSDKGLELSLLEVEKELKKHQEEGLRQIEQLNINRNEQAAE
jgi:hypothetical protein